MGKRAKVPDDGLTFDLAPFRRRRRELDLTQRGMVKDTGGDANIIYEWEKTGREPGLFQFIRACRAMGTPLWDLINVFEADGRDGRPRHRSPAR